MNSSVIASALHLDRSAIKALKITDVYSMHRVVYSLFEDVRSPDQKLGGATSGILWADQGGDFHSRKILLLSSRTPAPKVDELHGTVISKIIKPEFLGHDSYRFKVIVNPTRRSSANGKLMAVKGREEIAKWFAGKAPSSWGFTVTESNMQVANIQVLQFQDKANRKITLAQAQIQGILSVNDAKQFGSSFASGIGRARTFGCGLLQIVPHIDNPFFH